MGNQNVGTGPNLRTEQKVERQRRVAATVRRDLCFSEKSSTDAAKEFADAVPLRFTVLDQQRELPPGALQVAVPILGPTCMQQAVQEIRVPRNIFCSAVPAGHASYFGVRAQRGCKYARCAPLVSIPSLLPRKPSNPRHTLYLFMC